MGHVKNRNVKTLRPFLFHKKPIRLSRNEFNFFDHSADIDQIGWNPKKYEKLSILINRIEQINGGAEPLISNIDSFTSVEDIVYEEYRQNKIPFIIKRTLNNNTELIKFKDLVK